MTAEQLYSVQDEIVVHIEKGKTLGVRCLAIGVGDDKGIVTVFFELNGQPRRANVKVPTVHMARPPPRRAARPSRYGAAFPACRR